MPELKAESEWEHKPSDGSYCETCKGLIIGKMFQLIIFIEYEPVYTKWKYCENCYGLLEEKKKL